MDSFFIGGHWSWYWDKSVELILKILFDELVNVSNILNAAFNYSFQLQVILSHSNYFLII